MIVAKDVEKYLTIDNIVEQIKDGWKSTFIITKNIIGESIWCELPEWDRTILTAKAYKIIKENRLLKE